MKKFLAALMVALLVSISAVAVVNAAQPNVSQTVPSATVVMTDADLTAVRGGDAWCRGLKVFAIVAACVPGCWPEALVVGVAAEIWC